MLGKKSERSRFTTIARPACSRALVRMLRPATKPWAGGSTGSFAMIVSKIQRWAVRERAMGPEQRPRAAASFGDREPDVVGPRGGLGVKGEPAQPRDREAEGRGELGRRAQHGESGGGQAIGSLVRSPSRPETPRPRKTMSVARRCAMASARSCLRLAASSFFCAFSRARASRSARTAASPASAA